MGTKIFIPPAQEDFLMRPWILAVIMLLVGLVAGAGAGYLLSPTLTVTTTFTSMSPTTATITSPTTIYKIEMATLELTRTEFATTTVFSTITSLTTFTETVGAPVKAEWMSGDGRLKVSSELIPEKIGESVVSYTVKVTVKNVSDKPITKVLIIIFPYIGDRLYEHWNWASHSAEITSLMPGESVTHEFLLLPKDMTSYKIAAFAL